MLSKAIIIGVLSTSAIGTGAAGISPVGMELAAGPVRIESGNGKLLGAHLADHSQMSLTIDLKDDRRLRIKF